MSITLGIEIAGEFLISRLRYDTLLVKEGEDATVFFVDQIQYFLIVGEANELPEDAFAFVFVLLEFEDIFVELLLECL